MIGVLAPHAQIFVLVLAGATTAFFAIPILVVPLKWARFMLWAVPDQTDLAIYFGRCLGAFVVVLEIFMIRAGLTGEGLIFVFQFMMLVWILMVSVHVVGAIQGAQPITETLEIGFWMFLIVLTAAFWPSTNWL
jgi:hypothetical protein